MKSCLCALVLATSLGQAGNAGTKWAAAAISHREVYDVSLVHTSGYLLTARGRTVVETRIGCGVTHTLQRSLADMTYKDGQPIRTDFVIETWESADGRTLRFHVRNTQSGKARDAREGTAKLTAAGGQVTFTSHEKPFSLPRGTMFPTAFSQAMLAAAERGHDLPNQMVFQGGGPDALVAGTVKIGRRLRAVHEAPRDRDRLLKHAAAAWPILISYFPRSGELPASEVAATLYANGLLGSFSLIYPQYTLHAKLVGVERLPPSC